MKHNTTHYSITHTLFHRTRWMGALLLAFLCGMMAIPLWGNAAENEQLWSTFKAGDKIVAQQLNDNLSILAGRDVPVGAVIAWNKTPRDLNGEIVRTLPLPDGWVECNGQILSDTASPLQGTLIPDMNGATDTFGGRGLFVRGGRYSGEHQQDQLQSHRHRDEGHYHHTFMALSSSKSVGGPWDPAAGASDPIDAAYGAVTDAQFANVAEPTGARIGDETRPSNVSMVWIMRTR